MLSKLQAALANLLTPGEALLVGVSGGPDSVALLDALVKLGWRPHVCHLNHQWRAAESAADAEFVRQLADRYGLPQTIESRAIEHTEDAARQARFAFFEEVAARTGIGKIALAHTADDQVETFLLRLLRGAGVPGLVGIWPERQVGTVRVIRPLLDVTRVEVVAYLQAETLAWREDASNADRRFARNRVRHELIPLLERDFNPAIRTVLARTAEILRDEDYYLLRDIAERFYLRACREDGVNLTVLAKYPRAVQRRLLRFWLGGEDELGGARFGFDQIESVRALATAESPSGELHLPDELVVYREYEWLRKALRSELGPVFEFVNGFHDTANAVATVIYTHSLEPNIAVVWSGLCNLTGVLLSSGAVAFSIITLLPVELILKVSSGAGFAMVFALLIAAILWNLGTWWLGLPASSSHTMVGSIIGVGVANQLMNIGQGTSGVDWTQATKVFQVLLISPVVGFACAALLFWVSKLTIKYPALYQAPKDNTPPPWPIRLLLILTCSGVSFSHGSNDGQKGMGLIMLILIGTVPTAYALNHAVTSKDMQDFIAASDKAAVIVGAHVDPKAILGGDARTELSEYLQTKKLQPDTMTALRENIRDLEGAVQAYGDYKHVPPGQQTNIRNDMYVTSEALRLMAKSKNPQFTPDETAALNNYKSKVDKGTKFIPSWVKVAVALALGLGTMVGWKRIVVTVGEKIGKEHLTYAQGACAELVAMLTISAADNFGLPVSTTHVLSSGVAGTMAANKSGLQWSTIKNIAMAWVFTLPVAALLSGLLFLLFSRLAS